MVKPNVLCIGFVKCGTTTFHNIMDQHNEIFCPGIKEPMYYGKRRFYQKGFDWYQKRYYPKKVKEKIIMEINPIIAKRVEAKTILNDYGQDIKIIVIIRNPMERLYSNFKMTLSIGGCFEKFEDNIGDSTSKLFHNWLSLYYNENDKQFKECSQTNFVASGEYYKVIKDYINTYGKDKVKVIIFEEFIKNTKKICQEVYKFIGVDDNEQINYNIHSNEGKKIPINKLSIKFNRAYHYKIRKKILLEKFPYVSKSFCKLIDYINFSVQNMLTKTNKHPEKMLLEDKELLRKYYYDDIKKLSKLLDIDLLEKWKM